MESEVYDTGIVFHKLEEGDSIEEAIHVMWKNMQTAAQEHPNKPRHLLFEVEGFRNDAGGFVGKVASLQTDLLSTVFVEFCHRVETPLGMVKPTKSVKDPSQYDLRTETDSEGGINIALAKRGTA